MTEYGQSNETPPNEIATQGQENRAVDRGLQQAFSHDIGRLQLSGNIILGNFILNQIDAYGNAWVVRDIEGWWEPPSADVPEVARSSGDGSYEVTGRYTSRSITINGTILPPSPSQVEFARDRLAQAANLVRQGAWFKTGNDPIRASFVYLADDIRVETVGMSGRTDFEINLRAVDPIKYAWNDATPDGYQVSEIPAKNAKKGSNGIGFIDNIGNYDVPVYLEISGKLSGPGSIFNKTTQELIILTQALKGSISRSIVNKQLIFDTTRLADVATLTTTEAHDFSTGDSVFISGIGAPFDGDKLITATPTDTTFSFTADAAEITGVASKALKDGIATIRATEPHNLSAGNTVTIVGVDSVFNGTHTVLATPTTTSLTFKQNRVPPRAIVFGSLISNIATITTADGHNFIVGESVIISGTGANFDGTFEITAVPSPTTFNYANTRTNARDIISMQMPGSNTQVVATTPAPHGFTVGESVNITGTTLTFDGGFTINGIGTLTDFFYERVRATEKIIITKARSNNVATITTSQPHGFVLGEKVNVSGISGDYRARATIIELPSATTFSYANTGSNQVSTNVPKGRVDSASRKIRSLLLAGNKVIVTTYNTHGAFINENITITGAGSSFDGDYKVTGIPFLDVLEFEKVAPNEPLVEYPVDKETGVSPGVFVELSSKVDQFVLDPPGQVEVGGSLPLQSLSGTATVSDFIPETQSAGNIIKTNNVQFTPGLSGASAVVQADILEIDTNLREVAFNGELEGARGRIDVLADFIRLAPGQNELEFIDSGNPDSESSLRVFYRSGWLS